MTKIIERKQWINWDWLKAPAPLPEMTDTTVVKERYNYWRIRTFYSIYLGYMFYYFSRNSFAVAKTSIGEDLGFSNAELGIVTSAFAVTYGISKFVSGILSDRANARYFMSIGLIVAGGINLLFGLSSSIWAFAIIWACNGWFQGFGWPPLARLLTNWYSKSERGRWWSFCNTSQNMGGFFTPFIVMAAITVAESMDLPSSWRYGLFVPGILCIGMGLFLLNRLRDVPSSLGLPTIEKFRDDYTDSQKDQTEVVPPIREILVTYILKNPLMWLLGISYLFVYIMRSGTTEWMPKYLIETKNYTKIMAGSAVTWFEVGGLLGTITAGWLSDKIFRGNRIPVNILFSGCAALAVLLLWFLPELMSDSALLNCSLIGTIGFFVFGPQMLIGVAAAESCHKQAAGTATGFIAIFAYSGVALTGYPLGRLIDLFGWQGLFIALTSAGCIATLLLIFSLIWHSWLRVRT